MEVRLRRNGRICIATTSNGDAKAKSNPTIHDAPLGENRAGSILLTKPTFWLFIFTMLGTHRNLLISAG
jgi:hypothetical protein